ncbi:MAG TPA: ABC transporter ATP-binding protein [Acidimicrobiales bacterium]|nr:ABC transporter ATP-binding protein [Acidimicrobiales bacterium]
MLHLPYRELPLEDPGTPDQRSPVRFLWWVAVNQRTTLILATFFGVTWMLSQALLWAAVGGAIDHGVATGDGAQLIKWVGVVLALGVIQAVSGAMRHQLAVTNWMWASYRTIQLVGRHVTAAGTALIDEIPAGDIVNTVAADAMRIGGTFDALPRFVGALASWVVVSFILLGTSVQLGLIVLIGVPVLVTLTAPLMKPLHSTQAAQREAAGRLAALGSDTVAGLRILRGVGGEEVFLDNYRRQSERVRRAGVRIAGPQAGLESGQVLLPAILTGIITWLGARDVMNGSLQSGQLVAFFGYSIFLTTPLRTAIEYTIATTRAYVGAGKVLRILSVEPLVHEPASPREWPTRVDTLEDRRTGLRLERGRMVAVVTETPAQAAELADRFGRFVPDDDNILVNGIALNEFSVTDTRSHIVVNEIEPRLFSGELRYELVPHRTVEDREILDALEASSALDVLDALEDGLDTHVEERGRSFSGGQRQRLSLARAILTNADVLILVEPTSAVDTHTESRIAQRLGALRRGRTTLIASTSPVVLEQMDAVYLVSDNRVIAQGVHQELLDQSPLYRQIVLREDAP